MSIPRDARSTEHAVLADALAEILPDRFNRAISANIVMDGLNRRGFGMRPAPWPGPNRLVGPDELQAQADEAAWRPHRPLPPERGSVVPELTDSADLNEMKLAHDRIVQGIQDHIGSLTKFIEEADRQVVSHLQAAETLKAKLRQVQNEQERAQRACDHLTGENRPVARAVNEDEVNRL